MYVYRNYVNLENDTFAYVGRISNLESANVFKDKVEKYVNIFNSALDLDIDKLSDEEFYYFLIKIYFITLDKKNFLKVLSIKNNKKYNKVRDMNTFMTYKGIVSEGFGRSFDWWEQLYQVIYEVAVSNDVNINNDLYTKEKIKELVQNKDIVILKNKDKPLYEGANFFEQDYESFPTLDIDINRDIYFDSDSEDFLVISDMLRKKFTKKKILMDIKYLMQELDDEINDILLCSEYSEGDYNQIAKICKEWLNNSNVGKNYKKLQKKLDK